MAKPEKPDQIHTTRDGSDVAAVAQEVIQAAAREATSIGEITSLFQSTHDVYKDMEINEKMLQKILIAMIKQTNFQDATIVISERELVGEDYESGGKVLGGKSTTIGKYTSRGCYQIWFERNPQGKILLRYSQVPEEGFMR